MFPKPLIEEEAVWTLVSKSPALAALLNLLFLGLGYLYLGKKTGFGILLVLAAFLGYAIFGWTLLLPEPVQTVITITSMPQIVVAIALAVDAYQTAKSAPASAS